MKQLCAIEMFVVAVRRLILHMNDNFHAGVGKYIPPCIGFLLDFLLVWIILVFNFFYIYRIFIEYICTALKTAFK